VAVVLRIVEEPIIITKEWAGRREIAVIESERPGRWTDRNRRPADELVGEGVAITVGKYRGVGPHRLVQQRAAEPGPEIGFYGETGGDVDIAIGHEGCGVRRSPGSIPGRDNLDIVVAMRDFELERPPIGRAPAAGSGDRPARFEPDAAGCAPCA